MSQTQHSGLCLSQTPSLCPTAPLATTTLTAVRLLVRARLITLAALLRPTVLALTCLAPSGAWPLLMQAANLPSRQLARLTSVAFTLKPTAVKRNSKCSRRFHALALLVFSTPVVLLLLAQVIPNNKFIWLRLAPLLLFLSRLRAAVGLACLAIRQMQAVPQLTTWAMILNWPLLALTFTALLTSTNKAPLTVLKALLRRVSMLT